MKIFPRKSRKQVSLAWEEQHFHPTQQVGIGVVVAGEVEYETVDSIGGQSGLDHISKKVQALGDELAGRMHTREILGAVQFDLSVVPERC